MPYVLVVESDAELARKVGDPLREAGYELATETEGAWARRSLLVRSPDALIIDTALPDGGGFAVADAVRKDADTRDIPIFFLATQFRGQAHATLARRRYAPAEYFQTPVDPNSVLAALLATLPPAGDPAVASIPGYPSHSAADAKVTDQAQQRERRQVENEARQLAIDPPSSPWTGTLQRLPFARLMRRLFVEQRSGALLLTQGQRKKIIHFQDGYPVSVRSNVLSECLGQILLQGQLISQRALDESLRRMKIEGKQQGQLLVEMGALSPYNLQRALGTQMEEKLLELFSWRAGTFTFNEGKEAPGQPVRLEKAPAALIREGIRRHYTADRQRVALGSLAGQYVVPSADPLRRLQEISADPAERRFIEGIDGTRRLETLLENAPVALSEARILLVAMAEAGMIEGSSTAIPRPVPDTQITALEEWEPTFDRTPDRKSRDELVAVLEAMRSRDLFEVLGLDPDAAAAQIQREYNVRARDYHPDKFRARPDEIRQVALRIFERLGEAQLTLNDPQRRKRYLSRLQHEQGGPGEGKTSAPSAAEKMYFAGVDHLRSRRYREASEAFRQALALAPGQASYQGALGWAVFRAAPADPSAVASGRSELEGAVAANPQDPWIRISLGRFFAETGESERAIAQFRAALKLDPGLSDIQDEIHRLHGGNVPSTRA